MEGTLCYRHGHLPDGCSDCARLWEELARTTSIRLATRVVWPEMGPMSAEETARQMEALVDGSLVYDWRR